MIRRRVALAAQHGIDLAQARSQIEHRIKSQIATLIHNKGSLHSSVIAHRLGILDDYAIRLLESAPARFQRDDHGYWQSRQPTLTGKAAVAAASP